jgi:hypothetical protein
LSMNNNKIYQIEEDLFKSLNNLNVISLESNSIIYFNKNSLVGLTKLSQVCLYDNPVSILFPTSLSNI